MAPRERSNTSRAAPWLTGRITALLGAGLLAAAFGCSEPAFRYVPNPPVVADGPKFQGAKAAVIRFRDFQRLDRPRVVEAEKGSEHHDAGGRAPGALREWVYPLFYRSPTWPRITEAELSQALADELNRSGLFESARYVESREFDDLPEEALIVQGVIREARVSVREGGRRTCSIALELSAWERFYMNPIWNGDRFWTKTIRREAEFRGRPPVYEIGGLLRGLFAEAVQDIGQAYEAERAAGRGVIPPPRSPPP